VDDRKVQRFGLLIAALCFLTLTGRSGAEPWDGDAIRETHAAAGEAYEQEDYDEFLIHGRKLVRLAPHSTRARYNLARAQSLTGDIPASTSPPSASSWMALCTTWPTASTATSPPTGPRT